MWVEFEKRFAFHPAEKPNSAVVYKPGYKGRVTKECAEKAIAGGYAKATKQPANRDEAEELKGNGRGTTVDADQGGTPGA